VYIRKLVAALDTKRYRKLSGAFRISHTTDNQEFEHFKRNLWHGRPAICGTDQRPFILWGKAPDGSVVIPSR